ncbi:MAG: Fpg/Nei family DNA glycosylase [Candidatus Eisenbacteria bacterium]|uniref:Fpg/Nei family DNA glycosylase n=1 Tax=Eiseniibacteriota bacterium TaxID=2212470 RepID=A0A538TI60_UNCEI|nr:MAG: Fpg/Nei family DNA glycosylase [Candidatus Eisenbacteria bacterium]
MPELPFLEILAENLAAAVSGRRIEAIEIRQPALLRQATPSAESFRGEYLSHPSRVGKYLVFETESRRAIVIHLMRLGRLSVVAPEAAGSRASRRAISPPSRRPKSGGGVPRNVSARFAFDDGSELRLIEHGTEKRARLWLVDDLDAVEELRGIGPDPMRGGLTREAFDAAARATSRQLKSFLTDQRAIAGIGNGLADEILFEARLSPLQRTGNLSNEEMKGLYEAVRPVLERQVALLRESAGGQLPQKEPVEHYVVHDHKGEPCPRCGTPIAWISYAERDTFYCPGCQTGGTALKDRRLSKLLK